MFNQLWDREYYLFNYLKIKTINTTFFMFACGNTLEKTSKSPLIT